MCRRSRCRASSLPVHPLRALWASTGAVRFDGAELDCPVYQRERLDVGSKLAGPALLEQLDCTTFICPEQVARVDEWKNLLVTNE